MQKKEKNKWDGRRKSQSDFHQQIRKSAICVHVPLGVAALWPLPSIFLSLFTLSFLLFFHPPLIRDLLFFLLLFPTCYSHFLLPYILFFLPFFFTFLYLFSVFPFCLRPSRFSSCLHSFIPFFLVFPSSTSTKERSFVVVFSRDLLSSLRVRHSLKTRLTRRLPVPNGRKKGTLPLPLSHADGIALTTLRMHVRIPNFCHLGVVSTCFPSSSLSLLALRPVMSWFWFSPPATGMFFIPSPSFIPPLAFCAAARPLFSSSLSFLKNFPGFLSSSATLFFPLQSNLAPRFIFPIFPWLLLAPAEAASSHSHLKGVKNAWVLVSLPWGKTWKSTGRRCRNAKVKRSLAPVRR